MKFTQRVYPLDQARLTELGAKNVQFFTADASDGLLLCLIHAFEPVGKAYKLHISITARPVWGTIRGRRPTDEEVRAVQEHFTAMELEEDNVGVVDGFVRNLWSKTTLELK